MITIITGVPGMGKTAMLVHTLLKNEKAKFDARPVFVMGVNNLLLDHSPSPPIVEWTEKRPDPNDPSVMLDYYTFPPNSILVVDEAQRVFRARSSSTKPLPHVMALETHRHTGIDIILLTQKPHLMDLNVRELCGRHVHIKNTLLGRRLFEWYEFNDVNNKSNLDAAVKRKYSPPKEVFSLYKSAEVHTKQPRRIHQIWLYLGVCLIALAYFSTKIITKINSKINANPIVSEVAANEMPAQDLNDVLNKTKPLSTIKTPVQDPKPIEHPYIGYNFTIKATIQNAHKSLTYYQLSNGSNTFTITDKDLKDLGYSIKQPNDCSSFLFFKGASIVATCNENTSANASALGGAKAGASVSSGVIRGETPNGGLSIDPHTFDSFSRPSPLGAPAS
jgi:hypothetical protein